MLENNLNERLLNDNTTTLNSLGITENIYNILNKIHFTITTITTDTGKIKIIVNAREIDTKTFDENTWNVLSDFSEGTFHLADWLLLLVHCKEAVMSWKIILQ